MTAFTASKFSQTILRTLCILHPYCPNTCFARLEQEHQTSNHNHIGHLFREHQLGRREGNKFPKSTRKIISVLRRYWEYLYLSGVEFWKYKTKDFVLFTSRVSPLGFSKDLYLLKLGAGPLRPPISTNFSLKPPKTSSLARPWWGGFWNWPDLDLTPTFLDCLDLSIQQPKPCIQWFFSFEKLFKLLHCDLNLKLQISKTWSWITESVNALGCLLTSWAH